MTKQAKKIYRILACLLSIVLASGTLVGCWRTKYGPTSKYGPPPASGYQDNSKGNNVS